MDRRDHIIQRLYDPLEKALFAVRIGIVVDIVPDRNVVAEEVAVQIHDIRFAAPEDAYAHPFPGDQMRDAEILIISEILIVRIEHGRVVIRRRQELQSLF